MLVGENGIITQAQKAAQETEQAQVLEEINLYISEYQANQYAGTETRNLSEYLKEKLGVDPVSENKYGTLMFKIDNKILTVYKDGTTEIKDYQENTLANNAQILREPNTDADITADDGFLTDDGVARKYVKSIIFDTTNTTPINYNISWDVSELKDGTVIAYATGDETNGYDVTIVANGEIYLPENSTSLFQYCGYNENLPEYEIDLTGVNAITAKNMDNLFCDFGYYSMTNFYVGDNFDTSNVTNMEGMFGRCGYMSMVTLDLGNNFYTSNVTNMKNTFLGCGYMSLISLDLKDNFDTSNVISMNGMFRDCGYTSMITLNLGNKFDTSNVTNMEGMFLRCGYTLMLELDLGDKFVTTKVENMKSLFYRCENLENLYLGNCFNEVKENADITNVLYNCGTSTCKYYVSTADAQTWLLNLNSNYRRTENWNAEYILVQ